ncbi:hypothetical protein [Psychromonas aquimarina]|uniref:hypothetical protein n=1 Tax=Psychromonas aquimarina TaxID=444919 RepID=UPI00040C031B|nr:hypothetical protein [Psychromonas aquimarina]
MRKYLAVPLLALSLIVSFFSSASLSVKEPRIVLTDKNKKGEFKVYNTSDKTLSFRVSLIEKQMDGKGNIKTVSTSLTSAGDYVRVGPRMGKNIAPKDYQKFRLRAKFSKMPEGEFRSHLLIEPITPPTEETAPGIHLKPTIKYSIPLILRHGQLQANVSINNARVIVNEKNQSVVQFDLLREGERSVYGDVQVFMLQDNKEILLTSINSQAIYTDINSRKFSINLQKKLEKNTQLKILFKENPEFGGDSQAQSILKI